jgi:hypothetical protein
MRTLRPILVLAILILGVPAIGSEEIQLTNWTAPLFWQPGAEATSGGGETRTADGGKRQALALPSDPLPFVAITPCRIADTRGYGFTGAYGLPFMAGGVPRNFTITGQCGIPAGAQAVSFNFTVTNTAGPGFLLVFPQGGAQPNVSTLNYVASQTIANAAVVPLGSGGLTAIPGVSGFDLLIDVNGYYAPQNSFCIGADCRTSWNGQDANSVTPLPRNCAPGQVPVATGSYQWKCGNICQTAGTADCGGTSCANFNTDPNNCGACGSVCQPVANGTPLCSGGACGVNCNASFTACGNVCLNLATDPNHCGTCSNVCGAGRTCVSGACVCSAGMVNCAGTCVNLATDPNHCGTCSSVCAVGHACVSGACQ